MCFCIKSVKKKTVEVSIPNPYHLKYEIGQLLGNGGFGKVYDGKDLRYKESIVIKVLHKKDQEVPREVLILQKLEKHPHIISPLEHFYHDSWYIVMEKFGNMWNNTSCDLFEMIEHFNVKKKTIGYSVNNPFDLCLSENVVKKIINQLLLAVEFLRYHNVLHRDLKDENILVDQEFNIKLADFGSATLLGQGPSNNSDEEELNKFGGVFSTFMGTIQYASPEVVRYNAYCGYKQEVWSFGILLFTMIFGYSPFQNKEEILYRELLFNGVKPSLSQCVSEGCKSLLLGCLHRDMNQRYSFENLILSEWLNYTPLNLSQKSQSWDKGPDSLYNIYSVDRYRSWSFVRKIGEPFDKLYQLHGRKDSLVDSIVNKMTRIDTKIALISK